MKKQIALFLFLVIGMPLMADGYWRFWSSTGQENLKATITDIVDGTVWDTTANAFGATASVAYSDRDVVVTEDPNNLCVYSIARPSALTAAGTYLVMVYQTGDGTLDSGDNVVDRFSIDWSGSAEVWNNTLNTAVATVDGKADTISTAVADIPTVAEFEARTIVSADYFDPDNDTVANVTLVDTTTTNTDMRGTDNAATATALGTAQTDLDTLTGTDGVTLATSQPNYAPATATALGTAQTDLDTLTGTDGVTLATSQPNYAPATATDVTGAHATTDGLISGLNDFNPLSDLVFLDPNGLENIPTTAPVGAATDIRGMIVQTWRRFFKRVTKDSLQIKTYADDNETVLTKQDYTAGTTDIVGPAEPNDL